MIKKAKLVLALLLINALVFSQSNSIDEIVAIVGQKIILKSEVESQMLQYKSRGETFSGNLKCHVFCKTFCNILFLKILKS